MDGKNSVSHKKTSFTALWSTIESTYGEIPEMIKIILLVNGFDSFLALRGIRYDDKNEFFKSLEATVIELGSSEYETEDKNSLDKVFGSDYNYKQFKIKPGHRNFIMNLMIEIDKVNVEEFFSKVHIESPQKEIQQKIEKTSDDIKHNKVESVPSIKSSPKHEDNVLYQIHDHVYTNDEEDYQANDEEEEHFILEEYIDDSSALMLKVDNSEAAYEVLGTISAKKSVKRKPDRMYNEEFLSQCVNPRRRRVSSAKIYPDTDEGTRERFCDLIQQSMQCILSQDKLDEIGNASLVVAKESDTSWIVVCPLCDTRIKLAVVFENNGRYRNYKRSNFERHLRFKHCKVDKAVSEAIRSIEDYEN